MAVGSTFTWRHALQLHSTLSPFDSPFPLTHPGFKDIRPVSWKRFNVAGLLVTVYGLEELPERPSSLTCAWLMHGRGDTQDSMGYTAAGFIHAWDTYRTSSSPSPSSSSPSSPPSSPLLSSTSDPGPGLDSGSGPGSSRRSNRGLLCITFDQRNHGSRLIDDRANNSWKQGNPTHAQDMFATYSGTASDLSHLVTHLPGTLFSSSAAHISNSTLPLDRLAHLPLEHIAAGVSLGGHATWLALCSDPRIRAGIVVVGCPDYIRLMSDRAIRSKLPSCTRTSPAGRDFLGSSDFPASLVAAVEQVDPAGIFLAELDVVTGDDHLHEPSDKEKQVLQPLLHSKLGGKKILCVSGGKDRLVPHELSRPFVEWLHRATEAKSGWCRDADISITDFVDPNAKHEFSSKMRHEAETWLCEYLSREEERGASHHRASRL